MTLLQIKKTLWGRAGQNIFGWGLFAGEWVYNVPIGHAYPAGWYWMFRCIIFGLTIGVCMFNNFFLMPKLVLKKKYFLYVVCVLLATVFTSFCFNLTLKCVETYFPDMHVSKVSFIMTDIPKGWTIGALWEGTVNHFFFIVDFVVLMTMAGYIRLYAKQQQQLEAIRQKQVETELSFLKSQVNPHFLFNTLNNIYGLALKKTDRSAEAIMQLSIILRYLLYESNIESISFEKEKEMAEAYIGLEMLRLEDTGHFEFHISADRPYSIPPLLWLPVLENVFKHATRVITDKYFIEYGFEIQDNVLHIHSKNNYKPNGHADSLAEKTSGIGLDNLKKRLALLYPGRHSLETRNDGTYFYTDVKITLA